ncbi:hypothetical protein MNB_SV-6-1066 [hydrothermal vent metagenome]|uniref:Uncharacterized protein n=1 Tax=hydrothermal vent metagenome TaxID=652676 RepID=A0A1W1BC12_9ZZZZ
MEAIYHANINELSLDFIKMLQKQFANATIDIVIRQNDETDYLNSSNTNRKYLEEAILEVENSKLIDKSIDELGL